MTTEWINGKTVAILSFVYTVAMQRSLGRRERALVSNYRKTKTTTKSTRKWSRNMAYDSCVFICVWCVARHQSLGVSSFEMFRFKKGSRLCHRDTIFFFSSKSSRMVSVRVMRIVRMQPKQMHAIHGSSERKIFCILLFCFMCLKWHLKLNICPRDFFFWIESCYPRSCLQPI